MIISIIAAVDSNLLIGNKGKLPWPRIKKDLRYFRQQTMLKPIIMGRTTFESLKSPLSERINIILTKNPDFFVRHSECVVVNSVRDALAEAEYAKEVMIIGGAEIFKLFLPFADRMYITFIRGIFGGDVLFPAPNFWETGEWAEDIEKKILTKDEETGLDLCFSVYDRIRINGNVVIN
ncbi:MAG: dihydrofolate reductase [bacterium]|nr:dihydrofolate reductase [bacterium]